MEEIENVWANDRLGRKAQAEAISNYLITRSQNRRTSGLAKGFVLAIQSGYGEGKSYFVNNMGKSLSSRYPVGFIDAWTDDRLGSPFLAILDGIETALAPFFDTDTKIRETATKLISGSGKLFSGVALGMAKKAVEKAAGEGTEQLIEEIVESEGDVYEETDEIGEEGVKAGIVRLNTLSDSATAKGLKEYRQRKLSIVRLRKRLKLLSDQIDKNDQYDLPIFIFIDELDRCRPDYAITLLEEVKHLFDIPGFVFVLSIQKAQLLSAIKAIYGSEFEAENYIDRFVDKYYSLDTPNCLQFVELELEKERLEEGAFLEDALGHSVAQRLAMVFNRYGLSLREMERAIDILRASIALLKGIKVDPIFLSAQIVRHIGVNRKASTKVRKEFEPIQLDWIDASGFPDHKRSGRIEKYDELENALMQQATWNAETVERQKTNINYPELYYAYYLMVKFYGQFQYNPGSHTTMSSVCADVIARVKPFDVE